jgi:branched-subunit amino acid transport protein
MVRHGRHDSGRDRRDGVGPMDQTSIFLTLLGMQAVTYLPRLLPILWLSSRVLPPWLVTWLHYVPVAVLAAMLFPALLVHEGQISLGSQNIFFWAAWPTLFVVWKTRSFFGAVVVGMAVVAIVRYFG